MDQHNKQITDEQVGAATSAYIEACRSWDSIQDPSKDEQSKIKFAYHNGYVDGMKGAYESVGLLDDVLKGYRETLDVQELQVSETGINGPCYAQEND